MKKKYVKTGRNELCPCGSGKKYKKCCYGKKDSLFIDIGQEYYRKYKIKIKNKVDIEGIRKAGKLVVNTLNLVEKSIKPNMTTDEINSMVHNFTIENKAIPAPLNYRGFPKSVCTSVNEVICHGIPGKRILKDGDIINVDVTTILNNYYADANKTFFVGTPDADAEKIVLTARKALEKGMAMVCPENTVGDIGWAIQNYVEAQGYSIVTEFVGHGVGIDFHEPPQIAHFGRKKEGVVLVPGMVFTIEPMINAGKKDLVILDDKWTAVTKDRLLSAQFEQTVLVTEKGYESLTPF